MPRDLMCVASPDRHLPSLFNIHVWQWGQNGPAMGVTRFI